MNLTKVKHDLEEEGLKIVDGEPLRVVKKEKSLLGNSRDNRKHTRQQDKAYPLHITTNEAHNKSHKGGISYI